MTKEENDKESFEAISGLIRYGFKEAINKIKTFVEQEKFLGFIEMSDLVIFLNKLENEKQEIDLKEVLSFQQDPYSGC